MSANKPTATLKPVLHEVAAPRKGRPGYKWVEGFQVISPQGGTLFPYMKKNEARQYCRTQGWSTKLET